MGHCKNKKKPKTKNGPKGPSRKKGGEKIFQKRLRTGELWLNYLFGIFFLPAWLQKKGLRGISSPGFFPDGLGF